MDSVDFQILFNKEMNFKEELENILSTISENPESKIKKDDFNNLLNIKYIKKLSNSKFLVGFKINIWYSVLSQDIKLFCEYLNDNENCDFVIKFGDK